MSVEFNGGSKTKRKGNRYAEEILKTRRSGSGQSGQSALVNEG